MKPLILGLSLLLWGITLPLPTIAAPIVPTTPQVSHPSAIAQVSPPKLRRRSAIKSDFLPFFDQVDNPTSVSFPRNQPVDLSPVPPTLTAFDQKVLETCSGFGSKVGTIPLRRLMSENPQVLRNIQAAVDGEIFPGRRSENQFLDDLIQIWADRSGFEHIFCGEIRGDRQIGGLHFVGRYLQLQQQGIAGRLPNNSRSEEAIPGEVYTLGVEVRQNNRVIRDSKKGYAYVSDAEEIFREGTKAFKLFNSGAAGKQACIYTVQDDTAQPYKAVFVKTNRAIVTFYGDATPSTSDPTCESTAGLRRRPLMRWLNR